MAAQTKYRPSLTEKQILHIIELAKSEQPMTTTSMSLVVSLSALAYKIDNLAIIPAYTTATSKPRGVEANTSLEALGDTDTLAGIQQTKEQMWELAYIKYIDNQASCSLRDILHAREHMYLNDLMSDSEATAFELGEL